MTGPPVLWHFPISHYNEKARWALDWKRIPHVRRALAMSYVPRALWATGQAKLPILFLDGQAIADSTRIIEALERLSLRSTGGVVDALRTGSGRIPRLRVLSSGQRSTTPTVAATGRSRGLGDTRRRSWHRRLRAEVVEHSTGGVCGHRRRICSGVTPA